MIEIVVEGKPEPKLRARFSFKTGRAFTPKKTSQYRDWLRLRAGEAMRETPLFDGPVEVHTVVTVQIPKSFSKKKRAQALLGLLRPTTKPDVDNFLKSALDGLNTVVFKDDAQVVKETTEKVYGDKPMMAIQVRPWVPVEKPESA